MIVGIVVQLGVGGRGVGAHALAQAGGDGEGEARVACTRNTSPTCRGVDAVEVAVHPRQPRARPPQHPRHLG